MTKISIIVPVYNAEKYLSKCIGSIINQSYKDFEIICIEDKSKDNSLNILKEYSTTDSRIKIIENKKNIGAALSRNKGIDAAEGDYIYFIDADDYIDEKYIEIMLKTIEQENCDIVLNMSIQSDSNGVISDFHHPLMPDIKSKGEYFDKITAIHNAPSFIWTKLYKKSFLNNNDIRFLNTHADDVVFSTIVNMYAENVFVFYGETYHYTVNTSGMTGQADALNCKDLNHIKAHSLIYDYLNEHNKLDDKLKLFRVYPFLKVDTEEKFSIYKEFFEKIKQDFYKNEKIYNELEKYFAYSILNSTNYEEYIKNYNKIVTIGFLKQNKN